MGAWLGNQGSRSWESSSFQQAAGQDVLEKAQSRGGGFTRANASSRTEER